MIFAILYIDRLKCEHAVDQETGKFTIIFKMITYGEGPGRMGRSITAAPIFLAKNVGAQLSVEDSTTDNLLELRHNHCNMKCDCINY